MSDTHGPITDRNRDVMNALAKGLDELLNRQGFVLLVFDEDTSGGRVNYISNRQRPDMLTAMKELIARFEGRYAESGATQ